MTIRDTAVNATVTSAGYQDWGTSWTYAAARFSEYNNSGTGASATRQALTDTDAASYQLANYLAGTDSWAPQN
jgi:pectinesterase